MSAAWSCQGCFAPWLQRKLTFIACPPGSKVFQPGLEVEGSTQGLVCCLQEICVPDGVAVRGPEPLDLLGVS